MLGELLTHNLGQKMVGYANCISFWKLALHIFQNVFLKNTPMMVKTKSDLRSHSLKQMEIILLTFQKPFKKCIKVDPVLSSADQ